MFLPQNTQLTTVHEEEQFSVNIGYVAGGMGGFGTVTPTAGYNVPVTITTSMPNTGVTISGNVISGQFTDAFDNTISYRTVDDQFITVTKWIDIAVAIANQTLSQLYYYHADPRPTIVYSYVARAGSENQTYTINVDNDWMTGRNKLIKTVHLDRYQRNILTEWINNNAATIPWLVETLETIDWESENL